MLFLLIISFVALSRGKVCSSLMIADQHTEPCVLPNEFEGQCVRFPNGIHCDRNCRTRQNNMGTKKKIICTKSGNDNGDSCSSCGNGKKCKGDAEYCSTHQCSHQSNCYCEVKTYGTDEECNDRGIWRPRINVNVTYYFEDTQFTPFQGTSNPFSTSSKLTVKRNPISLRNELTSTSFEVDMITVTTPMPNRTTVLASKDGLNQLSSCSMEECIIRLPANYFVNPGTLTVKVLIDDMFDQEEDFEVKSFAICKVPGCVLCYDLYRDFECFPWEFKGFFVATIVFMVLASLLVLVYFFRLFFFCCMKVSCCKRCTENTGEKISVNFNKLVNKIKRKQTTVDRIDDDSDIEMIDPTPIRMTRETRVRDSNPAMTFSTFAFLAIAFLPLALGATCTQGITISTEVGTCYSSGTIETCTVVIDTVISVPSPGLSSCLAFSTPNGDLIGDMVITYAQSLDISPLQSEYFTSDWTGVSMSDKQCPWEHMCGSCATYDPIGDPDAGGLITGLSISYPGVSRCDSQCGCAGCGCFACDASCVFSRAAIQPIGGIYEVFRPISVRKEPQIIVNFTTGDVSYVNTINVNAFEMQVGLNFTLTIEGSLSGSTTVFGDQRIVVSQGGATIGAASAPNSPVKGSVGDIQSNSPSQFSPFGIFSYAAGLFTALPTSTATNYLFEASGIGALAGHDTLPVTRGTTLWTYTGDSLVGLNTDPGAVIATVRTVMPVTVTRTINIVCPEILNATLDGCYSCAQLATIVVYARSRCSAGSALVEVTGTYTKSTPSVVLSTEYQPIMVKVSSISDVNEGLLRLSAGPHAAEVLVEGTLVRQDLIVTGNQTLSNVTGNGAGFVGFQDWFAGLAEWMKGLLIFGMVIGVIIAVIVIIVITRKALVAAKRAKLESKYEKMQDDQKQRMLEEMESKNRIDFMQTNKNDFN